MGQEISEPRIAWTWGHWLTLGIAMVGAGLGLLNSSAILSEIFSNEAQGLKTLIKIGPKLLVVFFGGFFGGFIYYYRPPEAVGKGIAIAPAETESRALAGLVGVAGSFSLFLIVGMPSFKPDAELDDYVRLIGLSIVGGYGGITLVRQGLASVIEQKDREIDELEKANSETRQSILLISAIEEHLETTVLKQETLDRLADLGKQAGPRGRRYAYFLTRDKLEDARQREDDEDRLTRLAQRAVEVLEALIAAETQPPYWMLGQLGFRLQELGQNREAIIHLTRAIEGRAKEEGKPFYGYFTRRERSILAVEADPAPTTDYGRMLVEGLRIRLTEPYLKQGAKHPRQWVADNQAVTQWVLRHHEDPLLSAVVAQLDAANFGVQTLQRALEDVTTPLEDE